MRTVAAKSRYRTIALANTHESTGNPRRIFDESLLAELAERLRTQGTPPARHRAAECARTRQLLHDND